MQRQRTPALRVLDRSLDLALDLALLVDLAAGLDGVAGDEVEVKLVCGYDGKRQRAGGLNENGSATKKKM